MSADAVARPSPRQVLLTLAVFCGLGPLVGMLVALAAIVPVGMAAFGPGIAGAVWTLLWTNPWLPYNYGLLPAAATGIVVVVREARSGVVSLRFSAAAGALVALAAALFSGGHFPSTNPYQIAIFGVAGLVAAFICALLLRWLRRVRR